MNSIEESSKYWMLRFMLLAVLLAVSFYLWEGYLNRHFLGGFDDRGVPVSHSRIGFLFFITAWPLWLFPLTIGGITMMWWKQKRINSLHKHILLIEQQRIAQTKQIDELETQLKTQNPQLEIDERHAQLAKECQALKVAYTDISEDYRESKAFIEKLLATLNP